MSVDQSGANGAVDLEAKLALFEEAWSPKIVASYNDSDVMVAKFRGEFPHHVHEDTDDFFLVLKGRVRLDLEGRDPVHLEPGQLFVVPKGVRHRPVALDDEAHVLLIEPKGTPNSGDPATAAVKTHI
ncbi:MAG: cupin domain-containing protein [Pseudomonadota bacterium]